MSIKLGAHHPQSKFTLENEATLKTTLKSLNKTDPESPKTALIHVRKIEQKPSEDIQELQEINESLETETAPVTENIVFSHQPVSTIESKIELDSKIENGKFQVNASNSLDYTKGITWAENLRRYWSCIDTI